MREIDCQSEVLFGQECPDDYIATWVRLQQFVHKDTSTIADIPELSKIASSVAIDVQAILSMVGIPIEVNAKKPSVLELTEESKEDLDISPEGIVKRVMVYRLPEKLVLIGVDIDAEQKITGGYMLYVPISYDPSEMLAHDLCETGDMYKPGESQDPRQSQLFAQVLQNGVKDSLSIVPSPASGVYI